MKIHVEYDNGMEIDYPSLKETKKAIERFCRRGVGVNLVMKVDNKHNCLATYTCTTTCTWKVKLQKNMVDH